jgi:hypothetical protein
MDQRFEAKVVRRCSKTSSRCVSRAGGSGSKSCERSFVAAPIAPSASADGDVRVWQTELQSTVDDAEWRFSRLIARFRKKVD